MFILNKRVVLAALLVAILSTGCAPITTGQNQSLSAAVETTLVCRGRVVESTLEASTAGETTSDSFSIDDARQTVMSSGKSQPVSKFSAQAIEITKVGPKATAVIFIDRVTGAYSMRLSGQDPPLKLVVAGECRDPSARSASRDERLGSVTGSVYSNPFLGITLKIPQDWESKNAAMEKRMASLPDEVSRVTLLTLVKMGKDRTPEGMVLMASEKVVGGLAAKDYLEAARAVSRQRKGVMGVSEVKTESIAGLPYSSYVVTTGTGDEEIRVKSFARIHKAHVVFFMLTYSGALTGARQRYEAEKMLGSIEYK